MYCSVSKVKELKKGDFFTLKDVSDMEYVPMSLVWVRGKYDRSEQKYECYKYDDINHYSYFKSERKVFVDFTF